jgi:DNA-binding transcriptional LysR family regulator
VLEQARDLLQRTEALKSLTSSDAEPHGLLRIGLSHALAEGTLIDPIQALTEKYPTVRLRPSSALTGELINRLLAGELDVAAVPSPDRANVCLELTRGSWIRAVWSVIFQQMPAPPALIPLRAIDAFD